MVTAKPEANASGLLGRAVNPTVMNAAKNRYELPGDMHGTQLNHP